MTGVAVKVTGVPSQTVSAVAETLTLTGRFGFTTIVIALEVAGLLEMQTVSDEVRMHMTKSPFDGAYVKPGLFVPVFIPLTCHWYCGETPPLTGVAVKVTGVPAQTLFTEAATEISTESPWLTVTV